MEKSTPIGLLGGFVLIFGTILVGDGWMTFFDPISLVIVIGGTVTGLFVTFSMSEMARILPETKRAFGFNDPDHAGLAATLLDCVRTARRDGPLAIEGRLGSVEDPAVRAALELAIDGMEPEQAARLIRTRTTEAQAGQSVFVKVLNRAGTYAPAFGMVGTLIGLIQMLQNLSDPSAIGPAMAVAMITTFWGALLANLVFLPLAGKIQSQMAAYSKTMEMVRLAVVGILTAEAPSSVGQRLEALVGAPVGKAASPAPAPLRRAA